MDLIPRKFYLDDMFDDFLSTKRTEMKCDIYEKDGCYHIEMDTPGFKKEDLNISVDNGYLTITAEKSDETNDDSKNYIRRERSYGKYERSFYLGDVDEENVEASFKDGTLKLSIPKVEEKSSKKVIEIKD